MLSTCSFHRVEHTAQGVDILLVAVGTDVEPRISLDGKFLRRPFQTEHLLAAEFLEQSERLAQPLVGTTQLLDILTVEAVNNIVVLLQGETAGLALCVADMLTQHLPDKLGVAGAHHQTETVVGLLCLLLLALVLTVTAPEEEDHENHESYLHDDTAKPHAHADESTGNESRTGGDEPSTDDTQHTGDTEDGTLTAPRTVGKTRTHSHHERHIGRRKGQSVVGTEGDKH